MTFGLLVADDKLLYEEQDENEYGEVDTGYDSSYLWLNHQAVLGAGTFVDTTLYASRIGADRYAFWDEEDDDEGFEIHDDRRTDVVGLRQAWEAEIGSRHYLRWGFDARQEDTRFDYFNNVRRQDPIDDPRFPPGNTVLRFEDTFSGEHYGVYLTDRIRLA